MNVMFNTYCNQRCCYCFGQDAMLGAGKKNADREISRENLQFVLRFIKQSGKNIINIIGGEPTLHPEFKERYEQIEKAGISAGIFSNCVMDEDTAIYLSKKSSLVGILLNIREPWEYSAGDWNKIQITLKHIKQINLSFRIYRLGFNIRFLFDLIDRFGLNRAINFAPALPSFDTKTKYLPLNKYREMGKEMVRWSRESKKRKISWYSDYGFILCGFGKRDLQELRENVNFVPITNCCAVVEVRPNLMTQRCFGMWSKKNEKPVSLKQFSTSQEAHRYFDLCSLVIKQRYGALKKCEDCAYFHDGSCGGGCMVCVLKRFKNKPAIYNTRIFSS